MAGTPKRKVLVVDDDPSWRQILSLELEELGYDGLLTAETGHDAFLPIALAAERMRSLNRPAGTP